MATFDEILTFTPPPYPARGQAQPFLKWAGGKRAIIPDLAQRLPEDLGTYWEPFVGGGALFFALDQRIKQAHLSDINGELILTYKVVRDHAENLITALQAHASKHAHATYYSRVRKQRKLQDPVAVAARFIYLNKTCFNGLYRVNKDGYFNVPKGRYKNPTICDADAIRNASAVLNKAKIRWEPFEAIDPAPSDFVYCDPPYDQTGVAYASAGFAEDDQRALRDVVRHWAARGVHVMLSNADTPLIRSLYDADPFTLHQISAPRHISCNGDGRGKISELIITTYTP